jgi:hypothetical protein
MLMVAIFCSKSEEEKKKQEIGHKIDSVKPKITNVLIDPKEPIASSYIRAIPKLKNPAGAPYVKFSFQWYVNGDPVPGANSQKLEEKNLKKGDTIYCRVTASRGKFASKEVKSDKVSIGNSPPVINYTEVQPFKVPGQFRYHIKAVDPDGDKLTYRLLTPSDQDIYIDPETGEIQWYIAQAPTAPGAAGEEKDYRSVGGEEETAGESEEKKPGPPPTIVKIVFEVLDSDGAKAQSSISLDLAKGGEKDA